MNSIIALIILLAFSFSQVIHSEHQAQVWQRQNLNKLQKYLTERQQDLVRQNPGSLWAVARAIKNAIKECRYQMRNELWDCPTNGFSVRPTETFGALMTRNFRETSFVRSLLSAAIAHSVSRACTESVIQTCGRKMLPHGNGFGEDIEFGSKFARDFMNYSRPETPHEYLDGGISGRDNKISPNSITPGGSSSKAIENKDRNWRERTRRRMINEHNDEVGRLVVFNTMRRECKCHGISGACTLKTCWKKLAEFKEVAEKLYNNTKQALLIDMNTGRLGTSLIAKQHKSVTPSSYMKSNKKRSSAIQSPNPLKGLGRSSAAMGAVFATTPSLSGTSIDGGNDRDVGGGVGGRLQAHQELNLNSINSDSDADGDGDSTGNGIGGIDTGVDINDSGGFNKQSSREFAQNNLQYSPLLPSQHLSPEGNRTLVKKRPIAGSIGIAASRITPSSEPPPRGHLIYAEQSLNYCLPIERYNVKGTKGRVCSERRSDANSCETLCCGRGHRTEIREEKYTCDCKFRYCCHLECNTCSRKKIIHKCQ